MISPTVRTQESRNQGVERGMISLIITLSDCEHFCLPVPVTVSSASLKGLIPQRGALLRGDTTNRPLNWKLRLPLGHFGLLMPLSPQAKKGIRVLERVIDSDYHGEIGLLLHDRGKKIVSGVQEVL